MSEDKREPSDFFTVKAYEASSIPPVEEIVLPPAEQRKQRQRRIAAAVAAAVSVLLIAWTARYFWHAHTVESAALLAGDTGRTADIEAALATLDDGELPGLRARLIATLAYNGERPLEDAQAALGAVDESDDDSAAERVKAAAYVALAEGRAADALAMTEAIVAAVGPFGPETAHVKSLAALAAGQVASAVAQASAAAQAVSDRPHPRYGSQHALALALSARESAEGRGASVADATGAVEPDSPGGVAVHARVLASALQTGGEQRARECLEHAAATSREKAWCSVALAELRAFAGDARGALAALAEADENGWRAPGDSLLGWTRASIELRAGNIEAAAVRVGELDAAGPTADPALRGQVQAELALVRGQADEALRILATVPGTPRSHLLVARASHAKGDRSAASASAARAATGPWVGAAKALVAQIALASGDAEAAAAAARESLAAAPAHPAFIEGNVAALLAAEANEEAAAAAAAAATATPDNVRALSAQANVHLAAEAWSDALGVLDRAVALEPRDAELQGKRGDAARFHEQLDTARTAYTAALEVRENDARALVGMLTISLDAGEMDAAESYLERIDAAGDAVPNDATLALLRVRTLVGLGAGSSAIRAVERIKRRRDLRGNAFIRMAIAELHLQGEFFPRAVAMFDQARILDYNRVDAYLGRAMAMAMDGRTNKANEAMRSALEAALPRGAAEGTPSPAADHPRLLTVRGRIEANLGRYPSARSYAERALAANPRLAEAHLLMAEVAIRTRRDPSEHLRAAATLPSPTPRAWWLLARRLGANAEGCAFAQRYLRSAPRAENADNVRDFLDRCEE